jgi:hypothetical protein
MRTIFGWSLFWFAVFRRKLEPGIGVLRLRVRLRRRYAQDDTSLRSGTPPLGMTRVRTVWECMLFLRKARCRQLVMTRSAPRGFRYFTNYCTSRTTALHELLHFTNYCTLLTTALY